MNNIWLPLYKSRSMSRVPPEAEESCAACSPVPHRAESHSTPHHAFRGSLLYLALSSLR